MRSIPTMLFLSVALYAGELTVAQRNDQCYAMRGQRSDEAVAAMRRAIEDPVVRACAAVNLREAGAVGALIDALDAGEPDTQVAAARELGVLGDERALEALGRSALSENTLLASTASTALGAYRSRVALLYLLKAAGRPTVSGLTALEQAARFNDPIVLPVAREVVARGDVAAQVIAMAILGDLGDSSDLPKLREIAAKSGTVTARGRGFGFMPPIDPGRVARNSIVRIAARVQ